MSEKVAVSRKLTVNDVRIASLPYGSLYFEVKTSLS